MPVDKTPLFLARVKMMRMQQVKRLKQPEMEKEEQKRGKNSLSNYDGK